MRGNYNKEEVIQISFKEEQLCKCSNLEDIFREAQEFNVKMDLNDCLKERLFLH